MATRLALLAMIVASTCALSLGARCAPARQALRYPARSVVGVRMADTALFADAATQAAVAATMTLPPEMHTMANLWPDIINTVAVAGLGLAGAYVTQGVDDISSDELDELRGRDARRRDDYGGNVDDGDFFDGGG